MKKRNLTLFLTTAMAVLVVLCGQTPGYGNTYLTNVEVQPAGVDISSGGNALISWQLNTGGEVDLMICDMDGVVVRRLIDREQKTGGTHSASWDGMDDLGMPVPDGAYFPMLRLVSRHKGLEFYNPTANVPWGGRLAMDAPVYDPDAQQVTYSLSGPALCQMRVGEEGGGPSYGTVLHWQPRAAGDHAEPWDGMDAQQVAPVHVKDKFRIIFDTIALPPNTLMVTGSDTPHRKPSSSADRIGVHPPTGLAVYIHSLHARHICRDPGVEVEVLSGLSRFDESVAVFDDFVQLTIGPTDEEQAAAMMSMGAEVYLFLDGIFQNEVKAPALPATVLLKTKGLGPGRHILTVNLRDREDHVGAMTIPFIKE